MSSLFSASWYRLADLVPRLRTQTRIFRHVYRGQRWHVIQDLASGKFLRLNPTAYSILSLVDGQSTLDQIWKQAVEQLQDDAPSQDEVLQLMTQLNQIGVLTSNRTPDIEELSERSIKARRNRVKQYIANPLALRVPLIDPDRFLQHLVGHIPVWARPLLLTIWLVTVVFGISLAALHWPELTGDLTRLVFTPEYIFTLILVFPLIKAIHELGHGIAIKLFGGQCHEMGLMFLVMVPIPYVDASHAIAFKSKYQRMLVGAAGMMIELFVASLALWLWTWTQPGLLRVFLHDIVILAGVVTLLFNLNPLLRFDGYYIFSDWLEIPNLGNKANQYFGYLLKRYLLRIDRGLQPPRLTAGEPAWLISFALLSFVYRMFIVGMILLFVASQFFVIGVLLAAYAFFLMILMPLSRTLKTAFSDPLISEKRPRLYLVSFTAVSLLVGLVGVLPLPSATFVEGVVWMPEQSQVRARTDCFGQQVLHNPGVVKADEPLLYCDEPVLPAELQETQARLAELDAELLLARGTDRVLAQNLLEERQHVEQRVATLEQRIDAFEIRSPHAGEFVMSSPDDFMGRWYHRGDIIGYLLDPSHFTLLVAVDQADVDRIRSDSVSIAMRSADSVHQSHPLRILRAVPAATRDLPSLALSLQGGGRIGLSPDGAPGSRPQALNPVFLFELELLQPENFAVQALGGRVYVRFAHTDESAARQIYRHLRELFIRRFGI
ncbi:PqqD family peptide modification chaperone [Nitrincola sp.]|uniref:PqqD family peptide modification chaperone n=1 Tax=Nitrincola sp. TaxID=1926584 RepID=UPI003A8DDC1E